MTEFGELLKEAKSMLGVSCESLAARSRLSVMTIRRILRGDTIYPSKNNVNAIANAIEKLVEEKIARDIEEAKRMREVKDMLRDVDIIPRQGHERWRRNPASQYLEAFRVALEAGAINCQWLEIEAEVSYGTIKNFLTGRVERPNPTTAQLMGIAIVRKLQKDAGKAWTQDERDRLLELAQRIKDAYKADYGDDLM